MFCVAHYDRSRLQQRPHNEYVTEKAAICKLFSIDTVKIVSDECWSLRRRRLLRDLRPHRASLSRLPCYVARGGAPCAIQRITIARECQNHGGKDRIHLRFKPSFPLDFAARERIFLRKP